MRETKVLEVRDRATFMPVLAVAMCPDSEQPKEARLLHSAGYTPETTLVMLTPLTGHPTVSSYDPHDWEGSRTLSTAHAYIEEHWAELKDGDVVDVRFILNETNAPCASDFFAIPTFTAPKIK